MSRLFLSSFAIGVCIAALSCARAPTDQTPAGAVRLFLAAMDESRDDMQARRRAYNLLAAADKRELQERSELATALAGREYPPWEMIVPGRYRLRFTPGASHKAMREVIRGDQARVIVMGSKPDQRAEVELVRERDGWRIKLGLTHTPEVRR